MELVSGWFIRKACEINGCLGMRMEESRLGQKEMLSCCNEV